MSECIFPRVPCVYIHYNPSRSIVKVQVTNVHCGRKSLVVHYLKCKDSSQQQPSDLTVRVIDYSDLQYTI